jgi:hypothetical protein
MGLALLRSKIKKGKNCAVFGFAGKRIFFFNICDVITSPAKEKSSANHYWEGGREGRGGGTEGDRLERGKDIESERGREGGRDT